MLNKLDAINGSHGAHSQTKKSHNVMEMFVVAKDDYAPRGKKYDDEMKERENTCNRKGNVNATLTKLIKNKPKMKEDE